MTSRWNTDFFDAEFADHADRLAATSEAVREPFGVLVETCAKSIRGGGKIFFFGNGGSAADAQHLATELTIRYIKDRAPIAAIALTTDSSAVTAAGNDMGFDQIFARQLEALARPGDIAIGFSTSGRSPNVLKALTMAKSKDCIAVGFAGNDGGEMPGVCDILLTVPANTTRRIQEMHILIGHMLCGALELELGLVDSEED